MTGTSTGHLLHHGQLPFQETSYHARQSLSIKTLRPWSLFEYGTLDEVPIALDCRLILDGKSRRFRHFAVERGEGRGHADEHVINMVGIALEQLSLGLRRADLGQDTLAR